MSIDTVVPIVILGLVGAHGSFISINVEDHWVNGFKVLLKSFLESIKRNILEVKIH